MVSHRPADRQQSPPLRSYRRQSTPPQYLRHRSSHKFSLRPGSWKWRIPLSHRHALLRLARPPRYHSMMASQASHRPADRQRSLALRSYRRQSTPPQYLRHRSSHKFSLRYAVLNYSNCTL
ncbi:uncharacterized protein LOC124371576 [Homalodisca vitripennis]|uniref:uncharacterized protein LOC124371576 n=1 Tax=Homalodisca vitripennis TaxID=197043 RepID=UPI001EEA59D1|nr:uncharacterized protein LOC124371576 [Homalodisca vitripennis]